MTGIYTTSFAKKADLASLKSDVDKLDNVKLKNLPPNLSNLKRKVDKSDVDKLLTVPVDLSKLSDVVKNIVKKDAYNDKIKNIEDKIPDITNVASKTTLNAKIIEVKGEIPNIIPNILPNKIPKLATKTALNAVEN